MAATRTKNDRTSKDPKSKDAKSKDPKSKNAKSKNAKVKNAKSKNAKSKDAEGSKSTRLDRAPKAFRGKKAPSESADLDVRDSEVHGTGVFARVDLPAGSVLLDYAGDRISWEQASADYAAAGTEGHTFYFDLGDGTVIDGGANGNAARFVNHGCAPNCETETDGKRVRIVALTDVAAGQELFIDYNLVIDDPDDPAEAAPYACVCGAPTCRGTMLAPAD